MSTSAQLRGARARRDEGFESRRLRASIAVRLFQRGAPAQLGRYVVEGLLGRGGMGAVYAAFDPLLQRRVAIKLLSEAATDASSARLHREAEALAALAHPNVVSVYEVGWCAHGLYVVMELVVGVPLSAWLEHHPDPAARCTAAMELLLQVAHGLAAAHAAGLVHRDVKPSNVLVGRDHDGSSRARVADFGLAQPRVDASTPPFGADTTPEQPSLGPAGTPRYMAPEQIDGALADARSDQFSYCVTAFEVLFGVPPFGGDTLLSRRLAIARGPTRPRLRGARMRRAYEILCVGLAESPSNRHRGMLEVIDRLEGACGRRRSGLGPALSLVGAFVAGGLVLSLDRTSGVRAVDPCAADAPAAVWWADHGAPALGTAAARLGASSSVLDPIAASMVRNLAQHDDAWHRACATATPADRDLRLACLAAHRAEAQQVFAALMSDERSLHDPGAEAVEALPDPAACNDAARTEGRDLYDPLHLELAALLTSADLSMRRGHDAAGLALALAAWTRAAGAQRGGLQARAELALGRFARDAGRVDVALEWFDRAHATATAIGDDATAVRAALELARREHGVERRAEWFRHAESARARLAEEDLRLEALYWTVRGDDARLLTDAEQMVVHHRHALEIRRAHDDGDPLAAVENLMGISDGLSRQSRRDEALAWAREAERTAEAVLGPHHATMLTIRAWRALMADDADTPAELAVVDREFREAVGEHSRHFLMLQLNRAAHESRRGQLDEAQARLERALELARESGQDEDDVTAGLHYQLGWVALRRRQNDVARREFAASIELSERLDPGGQGAVLAQIALSEVARRGRDWVTAIATLRDAIARLDATPSDPRQANAQAKLAAALFDSGDVVGARPVVADAERAIAATFGPQSQRMAELLQLRGDVEAHDGDLAAAIATYAEAERLMLALDRRAWANIGYGRLRQAELHWAAGDRATARAFAELGIAAYEQEPAGDAGIAEGRAWLAAHPGARR